MLKMGSVASAVALRAAGRAAAARVEFERALSIDPKHDRAQKALVEITQGN
jgi:Tfp pilus assembly protein PilF